MLSLLASRRFAPLFWCQFFAAFNDNLLKTALVFLILFHANGSPALVTLASGVFIAPFFFLSGLGGELADRFDKARLVQAIKSVEIFVAMLALIGFRTESVPILFAALAGFGILGALFGPVKYGILPDHLRREQLPAANALVEGATFIAILAGTIAGGLASTGHLWVDKLVIGFAFACWLAALLIPATGTGAPDLHVSLNIVASTFAALRMLGLDTRLLWGALVTSWFWLTGIVVLSLLPPLVKVEVGGDEHAVTLYLALFTIAVCAGSTLAAWLAHGRIALHITVIGALLIGLFALDLAVANLSMITEMGIRSGFAIRAAVDLAGLAAGGGLFIVPAFSAVQAWSDADKRARIVAGVNVLNAGAMTVASVLLATLQKTGVSVPALFAGTGLATFIVTCAIWKTMPKT